MPKDETLEDQVERHDRDLRDHAKTLSSIVEQLNALQIDNRQRQINDARTEERSIARTDQLERIERDIEAIKGVGNKLLWIVIVSVAGAFLAFVYRGGLVL